MNRSTTCAEDTSGQDLRAFVAASAPLPPAKALLFTAGMAELAAWQHAEGRSLGPLERAVRVVDVDGQPRPVLAGAANRPDPGGQAGQAGQADDVWAIGQLLAALLGDAPAPAPPGTVRSAIAACRRRDAAARPTAADLARHLRDAGRDLLLGREPATHPPTGETPATGAPRAGTPADRRPAAAPSRRKPLLRTAAGAVVAAGIVAAVLALTNDRGGAPSPTVAQVCLDDGCAAEARYDPDGGRVVACDNAKDGLSAVAVVTRSDRDGESTVWASRGTGTCAEASLDLTPGAAVSLEACTGDRPTGRIDRCSAPVDATA